MEVDVPPFVRVFPVSADLPRQLTGIHGDRAVRCVVLEPGSEPVAFSSEDLRVLLRLEHPAVFAASGRISGGNLDAALACDIRVASPDAVFHGPVTMPRRLQTLLRTTSPTRNLTLDGQSALDAGLVSIITSRGGALTEALRIARVIAGRGPIATRLAKEAVWRGLDQDFEQALRFETDLTLLLQTTKDRAEGVQAFIEKRPPVFIGE